MRRTVGITILVVIGLAVIGGVGVWWFRSKGDKGPTFRTVPVKRGDLMATISATGTVEPEAAVDVGAQVAGVIIAFGKDKHGKDINWGSVVEEGTVLAKIDDSLYAATVETAKAQFQQAAANKISADANVLQMKAKLLQAQAGLGSGAEARPIRRVITERLRPVPSQLRGRQGQPGGGRGRRRASEGSGGASEGQPHHRADQSRLLHHQVAGQGCDY